MRKFSLSLSIAILSLLFVFYTKNLFAQNPTRDEFNRALETYSIKYEEYNKAHDEYVLAKAQYIKFKTLASKTNAQAATVDMLQKRDEVVIYYLYAIRARLNDSSITIDDAKKNDLFGKLDSEVSWFNTHKQNISTNDSLENLIIKSDEAKAEFKKFNFPVYDSLFSISRGRMVKYRSRFDTSFTGLTDLVAKIRTEKRAEYSLSEDKLNTIDRWVTEIRDRLIKSDSEMSKADEAAHKMTGEIDNRGTYNGALVSLGKANDYLKQSISYTKEIIREIKIAE
ncbi:hypothetical protein A3A76_05935 [Candidatus Woesebacteria bacterium RIFCSPLOWO2_01_FULL_39_23]|uniref:Uncharacterized protein n=1 Tax=Candidatus Woesebacteria bacterium RIFCSPHIGHO2_01_FULL_40_22 TaxID=1802499 RepID=A0A1F7YI44_9BACT|nr:MAG: hypothetical protein A2141_02635 [Candidatus Woesebacteria bacterium RBG_16_40_11]OGM26942.1 MAG: hypothetical protein A2628_05880 [Candidatus Woesebacteria bacterium RIFCSPHIGHO2_01_FULL_40_22]OGM63216.1 MAG: hypothetical protein A3A76_05935 [Candidatus Woesebacteria bacterium RIFCSPLOWO2_01_FULL_39_23]